MTASMRQSGGCMLLVAVALGTAVATAGAAEVELGAARDTVIEALGEPDGTVTVGALEYLQFERGTVELRDGKVTHSTVVSEAAHQRRLEEQRKQAEEARRRAEKRRADLLRQGRAEKEQVLKDGSVVQLPLQEQVTFWTDFGKKYPDVDVGTQLGDAKASLAAESRRRQQELAEMEATRPTEPRLSSRRQRKVNRGRHESGMFDAPEWDPVTRKWVRPNPEGS